MKPGDVARTRFKSGQFPGVVLEELSGKNSWVDIGALVLLLGTSSPYEVDHIRGMFPYWKVLTPDGRIGHIHHIFLEEP